MKRGFTLIELIVVIIIVGILAAIGLTQYSTIIEKSRLAEAKVRISTMRQLAYEYYLTNGTLTGISLSDVGAVNTCTSSGFYMYAIGYSASTYLDLVAGRCTSGGKTPNASRYYLFYQTYYPATDQSDWHCCYSLVPGLPVCIGGTSCFGYPI